MDVFNRRTMKINHLTREPRWPYLGCVPERLGVI